MDCLSKPVEFTKKGLGRLFIHEIICYEPKIVSEKNQCYIEHLKKVYDYVKTCTKFEEVIHFLNKAETSTHLIVFGSIFEDIEEEEILKIENLPHIYLFGDNILDQKRSNKITFIGSNFEDLFLTLRRNVMRVDFPAFSPMGPDDFEYSTGFDYKTNDTKRKKKNIKLMDLARQKLFFNQAYQIYNEKKISDFIRDHEQFSSENILRWYASDSFIRRMGNFWKHARFGLQYKDYIQLLSDIYRAIRDLSSRTINKYNDVLYSKTYISDDEWQILKENLGKDIQIEGFLPASETKEELFTCINNKDKVFITIIVPSFPSEWPRYPPGWSWFPEEYIRFPSKWDLPFIELQEYSNYKNIREVLFNMKSRFRILEVEDNNQDPRQLVLLYEAYSVRRFVYFKEPYINLPNLNLIPDCRYCKLTIFNQDKFIYVDLENTGKICGECFKKHHQDNQDNGNQQPLLYIMSSKVKKLQNSLGASIKGLLMKSKEILKLPFYGYRCMRCKSKSNSYYTCLECPCPGSNLCAYCQRIREFCHLSKTEASKLQNKFEEIIKIFNKCAEQCFSDDNFDTYFPNCRSKSFRNVLEFLSKKTKKLMIMCKECQRLADDKDDKLEYHFRSLIQETRKLIENSEIKNINVEHNYNQLLVKKLMFPTCQNYEKELSKLIGIFVREMKTLNYKGKNAIKTHECFENELMKSKLPTYCQNCSTECVNKKHLLVLESCPYTFWSEGFSKEEHFKQKGFFEETPSDDEATAEYEIKNDNTKMLIKGNLENVAKLFEVEVVWYELGISREKMEEYSTNLKEISCSPKFFGETNKVIEYLNNIKTPIQFVISGNNMKIIEDIQKKEVVYRILIFGKEDQIQEEWKKKKSKFKCFNKVEDLKKAIKFNQKRREFPAFMPIFNRENHMQVNILHNYLTYFPKYNNKQQAKNDFINLAKKVYSHSEKQKKLIKSFEQDYHIGSLDKETFHWYTKESFVFELTNNSLRLTTPDSVIYCRFFIDELSQAIKNRYLKHSQSFHGILYRAAFISDEEWITLSKNVGRDIEMHGFLSTTKSLEITKAFGAEGDRTLIEILVPPGPLTKTMGFAEISDFSEFEVEEEVLFNIMSRFTILEAKEEINKKKKLVLLYGTQELKKYLKDDGKERNMFIEITIPEPETIQCRFCRLKMNERTDFLFYASLLKKSEKFICHGCLEKSKNLQDSPLFDQARSICDSPLLCLKESISKEGSFLKIKGFCMVYKKKLDIPFYGYQCAGCGQKNLKRRFYKCLKCPNNKWCEGCFGHKNQCQKKEDHLIVSETQPFSFWNEELDKSEREELEGYHKISALDAFGQAEIYKHKGDYEREVEYYLAYLEQNGSSNCTKTTVAIYRKLGYAYLNLGQPEKAVESCQKSLEITNLLHSKKGKETQIYDRGNNNLVKIERYIDDGGSDRDLVYAYHHLAYVCCETKKYDEAIEACLKSIEIIEDIEKFFRSKVFQIEEPYRTLSLVFNKLGQYENEITYYLLNLQFDKSPFHADLYDKIGLAYLRLGKFDQAIQNFRMAFRVRGSEETENKFTADLYQNLGMVYLEAKDYQAAIEYHLNSLAIRKRIHGKENVLTLSSYQNVGLTYYKQRKYQEAVANYSIALTIQISNNNEPFEIAITHENLGKAYYGLKKYQEAVDHHIEALNILDLYPEQGPLVIANSNENLGIAYSGLKKYSETIKFCMKSIEIKSEFTDKYDETFEECYTYLGIAFMSLNQYENASEYLSKALRITIRENSDQNKQNNLQNLLEVVIKIANEKLNLRPRTPDVACLYRTLGMSCKTAKKYEEAINFHSKTLEIRKDILGYKHIDTASSYQDLAVTYQDWQKYQEASENYSKALEILKLTLGVNHAETASCYKHLGSVYNDWGKYQEAVENYSKALGIIKLIKGDGDLETADVCEKLGFAYSTMKRYQESLEYNIKCFDIRKSILGEKHKNTALSYENIGINYVSLEQYQDAFLFHSKALEIRKVTLGYKHLSTASSYKHLGMAYSGSKQYNEATKFLVKSLNVQKSILKSTVNLELAKTYEKIGSVYHDWEKYKEAVDYHSKALEIRKSIHKDDYLEIASSYKEIGRAYYAWQKYQEALDNYLKDLELRISKVGDEHPDTASSYENIGMSYHGLKQYDKAIEFCMKSLSLKKALYEENHPSNENLYTFIGLAFLSLGEYEEANVYISKALQIVKLNRKNKAKLDNLENLLGTIKPKLVNNDYERALYYEKLGSNDYNLGKFQEAIEKHSKALQIRKLIHGEQHPDTASSYENIGMAYNSLKQYNKTIEYCSKSLDIKKSLYGENHPSTEASYTLVGLGFWGLREHEKAKEFLFKALNVVKLNGDKSKAINLETLINVIDKNNCK